jgi:hypothetical protein
LTLPIGWRRSGVVRSFDPQQVEEEDGKKKKG